MRLLPVALLALACGPADPIGVTREAILNGNADTADTSVVAVIITSANGPQNDAVCSGTVISPHVVLTAAHCLDPAVVGPIDHVSIFLGSDFGDATETGNASNFVAVASTSFDPQFTPLSTNGGHDLGLIVAATTLPQAPMGLNRSSLGSGDIGTAVHAVGFGQSSGTDPTSAGPRRAIDTTIFEIDSEHIVLDDVICEGDSGGPTFITKNGVMLVAGVHSFTTTPNCIGDGDDTRVDLYASSIIDPVVKAADPGFLPSGCNVATAGADDAWVIALALGVLARRKRA